MTDTLNLPTQPTYGWLEWEHTFTLPDPTDPQSERGRAFGVWEPAADEGYLTNGMHAVHISHVTGFAPAIVTEASDIHEAAVEPQD